MGKLSRTLKFIPTAIIILALLASLIVTEWIEVIMLGVVVVAYFIGIVIERREE